MTKLTKRVVDAAGPDGDKETFLWDGELRGFGVRVKPSGVKSYLIQYRNEERRTRRMVIGQVSALTVEEARKLAKAKLGDVSRGDDPSANRQAMREAITVAELCDWYLTEAESGRLLGRRRRPIKRATLDLDRSRIETHIKPLMGTRKVDALELVDIEAMQGDIAAGKTAKKRATPRGGAATGGAGVASRTMSTLHSIFEHGLRLGKIEANPARGVRRMASAPKQRRLNRTELEKFGAALKAATEEGEHPTGLAAIRAILLTGFRRMEALGLKREWLDKDEGCIRLADSKSGPQIRVIGKTPIKLLLAQPVLANSPYFFPADWGDGHFVGLVRVLDRLTARAKLTEVTPHTLRHTFASLGGDLGFSELTLAALLGHSARGVTQRYVHIDEALRVAADRISAEMAALLEGKTSAHSRMAAAPSSSSS